MKNKRNLKILVWNINTFGGRDGKKQRSKEAQQVFLKSDDRMIIEERIFRYVKDKNPDICELVEFDCQYRDDGEDTAAQRLLDVWKCEGMTPVFPLCKDKEGQLLPDEYYIPRMRQNNPEISKIIKKMSKITNPYYSISLCSAKKDLQRVQKETLGDGEWARINEFEIDGCVFIAVHMSDDLKLWGDLIKHASKLLEEEDSNKAESDEDKNGLKKKSKEKKPDEGRKVIIAGDFNACSPLDTSGGNSSSRAKEFALLLSMGYVDLTPKIKTFSVDRHDDHILVSPALAKLLGKSRFSITVDETVIENGLSDHACLILDISLP